MYLIIQIDIANLQNPELYIAHILRGYSLIIEQSKVFDNYPLFDNNANKVGNTRVQDTPLVDVPKLSGETMKFKLANPKTELDKYLVHVEEVESPGLISQAHEWIMEGWGLGTDSFPQEEQIAAALLMEAKTQDACESHPDYPKLLRSIAHKIMILAGHPDPALVDSYKEHLLLASEYEKIGNTRASIQLRATGNLLANYVQGHSFVPVVPRPENHEE